MRLRDYLRITDAQLVIQVNHSLGSGLSRSEIENSITDAGYPLPTTGVQFYIMDTNRAWLIRYFPPLDKYGVEKLNMK
jgi:hypothetical protein